MPETTVHSDLLIGSSSDEGETLLWYSKSGYVFQSFDALGDSPSASQNRCVAFSADGSLAATVASSDETGHVVIVWEVCSGEIANVFDGHGAPPTAVAFSPDGHCVASVDEGGALLLHRVSVDGCRNALSTANTIGVLLRGSALRARLTLERNNEVLADTNIGPGRYQEAMDTPLHVLLGSAQVQYGGVGALSSPQRGRSRDGGAGASVDELIFAERSDDDGPPTLSERAHAKLTAKKLSAGLEHTRGDDVDDEAHDFEFWRLEFHKLCRGVFIPLELELAFYRDPKRRFERAPWATPLHILADATLNGRGKTGQQRLLRQQDLIQAWGAMEDAAYVPVPNSEGQTPFEVAVRTGNTLFVQTALRTKGILDKVVPTSGGEKLKSQCEFLTVSDLDALLDTDPGIAAEFLEQPWLLQPAEEWAPQADDNCLSYLFDDADSDFALFLRKLMLGTDADPLVIVGQEYGRDVQSQLWYRHQNMDKIEGGGSSSVGRMGAIDHSGEQRGALSRCCGSCCTWCCGCNGLARCLKWYFQSDDIIGAIPEAHVMGIDGLSGPGVGRSVLKKLAALGAPTLPAFRSEAMRAVVQHTWVSFGRYAVLGRWILTMVLYVPLHVAVLSRHDQHRKFTLVPDAERRVWQLGWQHEATPMLTPNDVLAGMLFCCTLLFVHEEIWYAIVYTPHIHFGDKINVMKLAGPLVTIAAIATKFFSVEHASILAVAANALLWLRVINYFQGVPMFGFMVFLILESIKDIVPFMALLFVILAAFATSLQPCVAFACCVALLLLFSCACSCSCSCSFANAKPRLPSPGRLSPSPAHARRWAIKSTEAIESSENTFNTFSEGFFRAYLMLFGDWDLDTVTDSDFPVVAQVLFFAFVLIGPLVMLNIVIAILGNTFDAVMDSKNEVLLQLQLHETLALEHIYDAYLGCLCGKKRVLLDQVGRKPRWLHILREVRTSARRRHAPCIQCYPTPCALDLFCFDSICFVPTPCALRCKLEFIAQRRFASR